jgi:hypothetical protein
MRCLIRLSHMHLACVSTSTHHVRQRRSPSISLVAFVASDRGMFMNMPPSRRPHAALRCTLTHAMQTDITPKHRTMTWRRRTRMVAHTHTHLRSNESTTVGSIDCRCAYHAMHASRFGSMRCDRCTLILYHSPMRVSGVSALVGAVPRRDEFTAW